MGCVGVALNVDQLAGDAGVAETVQHAAVQVLRQFDQGVVDGDGDASEVLRVQAAFVGQGADDGSRAHVLALAHLEAVGLEVAVAAVTATAVAATTVVAVPLVAVLTVAAVVLRRFLHQEVRSGLRLCGQGCGDVLHRHVLLLGVGTDQGTEEFELLGFERLGDRVRELLLAGLVDLVDGRQRHLLELRVGGALDGAEHAALTRGDEQDRLAGASGTAGAADAVDVALGVVRDVVVDHVADAVDVQAAGGDVGGHQDVQAAVLELVDGALTLVLRDVAVDRGSGESAGAQLLGHFLGLVLGAHEDDHGLELGDLEDAGERVQLVAVRGQQVALGDVRRGAGLALDGDLHRVVEVLLGDAADAVGHRRGEQGDLLVVRGVLEDALDVLLEAHVQHLVGLVEHQVAQVGDVQRALLQVVDDAARGAHDDLGAAAQAGELDAVGLAAVDRQDLDAAEVVGEGLEGVGDLQGQFTRRCENQSLRGALLLVDAGQDRQRESRGLAGARLGEADDVAPVHQERNGLLLDGGRRFEADLLDCVKDDLRQAEPVESRRGIGVLVLLGVSVGGGRLSAEISGFCFFRGVGVVIGCVVRIRVLRGIGVDCLRSVRFPGVLLRLVGGSSCCCVTLRVTLRFRLVQFIRLIHAAGGVIGNAHR